ncbi:MAG: hypothetical protein ABI672_14755, partial [Vicinamibacteria bacterium]
MPIMSLSGALCAGGDGAGASDFADPILKPSHDRTRPRLAACCFGRAVIDPQKLHGDGYALLRG